MDKFEVRMKLDAADVDYKAKLAAITDEYDNKKEQIAKEFIGDNLAEIGDIIKTDNRGRFIKVNIRDIQIYQGNSYIKVYYEGERCNENGEPFKRSRTISRTDVFYLI